ncbi:MAG: hypothetical protein NPIRA05_13940 [Nitrospirales bacterium]|nr:MAG: hypothetical protein NPIRA05_13940 [Nitrospirales bacterium]
MKIAFTGASGTGKTSVAHYLLSKKCRELSEIPLVGVDSRNLLDNIGLKRAEFIDHNQYKVFQIMYFSQKMLIESGRDAFLTERSFADGLIYWKMHCDGVADPSEKEIITRLCREQTMKYDYHFLFPVGFIPLEDDGYRHQSPEYHKRFELYLESLLNEWGIKYIVVPNSDVPTRAKFVLDCLK